MAKAKKSIIFCHGIWADGSCFNKVIPTLQAEGYEVMSAQYGLDTNESDVATVKRTLGRVTALRFSSAIPTADRSLPPRVRMSESPGWSTSPLSHRTPARPRRVSSASSPHQTFSLTLKSPTGGLDETGRRRMLRRRFIRAGAKDRVGDSLRARRGLVREKCCRHRLEVQTELVHLGHA